MKKIILLIVLSITLFSCGNDDDGTRFDNPYLLDPLVNITLNLNLPEYNNLNFPGGSIVITQQGLKGVVVYNLNNDLFTAFEITDPNHTPNNCSRMTVLGIEASCPCPDDDNVYNILTGQHKTDPELYPMQMYRIEKSGNTLRITN
ncbi:hypothetical protein [Patiriisocius marinus]|uniref:Rieske domain-containing protein n=1 Tax=Patiriisocius marinus TaxID=1397112 RepID=A0A5J4IZ64_9FLAO|nr:hypothetical protein [Patiriisocius marinus]GER60344.1 hypothetical protein ULMA_24520 [Patiriisocius marinus]